MEEGDFGSEVIVHFLSLFLLNLMVKMLKFKLNKGGNATHDFIRMLLTIV